MPEDPDNFLASFANPYQEVVGFCAELSNRLGDIANSLRDFNFGEYIDPPGDIRVAWST